MANDQCQRHLDGGSAWLNRERERGRGERGRGERGREWALLRSDHVERMICQMLLKSWSEPFANYWLCSQIQLRCLCRLHCQSHLHHWNLHRWGLHRCLWKLNHSGKVWRYDFLMRVGLWIWLDMDKWWQVMANDKCKRHQNGGLAWLERKRGRGGERGREWASLRSDHVERMICQMLLKS